jgi:hypothetical protein
VAVFSKINVSVRGNALLTATDVSYPYTAGMICDALNGCVCKSGQDVGEVIADRDLEPSTTFHNREDGGYARPSLFAADVDPVGAANCDRAHGILSEAGAQLQLWSERAPEWIQPGGINRLATCLTQQAHGRFSAIRMEEGYLGLMRSGLETVQLTLEGKLPESPKGKHNE